jgi:hypothetical protein
MLNVVAPFRIMHADNAPCYKTPMLPVANFCMLNATRHNSICYKTTRIATGMICLYSIWIKLGF